MYALRMFWFCCVASASYGTWVGGATSSATLSDLKKEGEFVCYLRFRNSISWFGVVAIYSNPFSMSSDACLSLFAVLQWYSSLGKLSKSWVYLSVVLRSLCPNSVLTCSRSLVLWYSIVALKCLKSYSRMVLKAGSCSFLVNLFLNMRYCSLMFFDLH